MKTLGGPFTILLGMAGLALVATIALSAASATNPADQPTSAMATAGEQARKATTPAKGGGGVNSAKATVSQVPIRKTTPPLPAMGFAPVRPMNIVRATYDFAAQHPEVLKYVPCYCGCGADGHKANESCFVGKRDPQGNVIEWDTHGFGCAICVDVAREAMQLYSSGADVYSIRAAIEKKWTPGNAAGKTPTPFPPKK